MGKTNRKGFTIVELVIVIAVIAILAAVLIPTFASIVSKANESNLQQVLSAARKVVVAENAADSDFDEEEDIYYAYKKDKDSAVKYYKWDAIKSKFVDAEATFAPNPTADTFYAKDVKTVNDVIGENTLKNDATNIVINEDLTAVVAIKDAPEDAPEDAA